MGGLPKEFNSFVFYSNLISTNNPTSTNHRYGVMQTNGRVVHLLAKRLVDHSELLGDLRVRSYDFR